MITAQTADVKKYSFYSHDVNSLGNIQSFVSENTLHNNWHKFKNITDLTDPVVEFISSSNPGLQSAYGGFLDYLKETSGIKEIDTYDFNWRLRRRNHSYIRQEENLYPNNDNPSLGSTKLRVKLSVGWIRPGTYIWPESAPEAQVIVDNAGQQDGTGFIYTTTKNANLGFFPPELLKPGIRWCVGTGAYSEGSRDYAGFYMSNTGWIEFKGTQWSTGQSYEVTDSAVYMNQANGMGGTMSMVGPEPQLAGDTSAPKQGTNFFTSIEGEFVASHAYNKKKLMWIGEDFKKLAIDGSTGLHRKTGVGLRPLLRFGNRFDYMPGVSSLKHLQNSLKTFQDNKVPYDQRGMIANGGSAFITWVNEIITEAYKQSGYISDMKNFTSDNGPTYAKGYKGLVFQTAYFTKWVGFPYGEFQAVWEPFYDDETIHGAMRFDGNLVSSYEANIWDGGFGNGFKNNVRLVQVRNGENYNIEYGTFSPAGPTNNFQNANAQCRITLGRRYIVALESRFGIYLNDVTLPIVARATITH